MSLTVYASSAQAEVLAIELASGTLDLTVERAEIPIEQLCGFAARRSRKRGFVFVSKVLGKHYPVRPSMMDRVHALLAARIEDVDGPAVIMGLAETATGLGHGIYEHWLRRTRRDDLLFVQSTRYGLRRPLAMRFQESHSHATEHLLYTPEGPHNAQLFANARTLVVIDDELSTGQTLINLASAYRMINPGLREVCVVSITDWLHERRRELVAEQIGVPVRFHSLLAGSFTFEPNAAFDPGLIPSVDGNGGFKDLWLPTNHGRLGLRGELALDVESTARGLELEAGARLLILGSGEFLHPPFLLARHLEEQGWDVHYQSSTRSPLLVDHDIQSVLEFVDNYHDGIPNFLYNVTEGQYDRIVPCYETWPLPTEHSLPEIVGGRPLFF